jgi:nucleotide-binding universal stress UspA family protein
MNEAGPRPADHRPVRGGPPRLRAGGRAGARERRAAPPLTSPDVGDQLEAARAALAVERELIDPDLDVELVAVAGGDVPEAIAEHAARSGADLIALSTHGRAGFRRLILGSVAEAVLHHAHVPVLCFPRPA